MPPAAWGVLAALAVAATAAPAAKPKTPTAPTFTLGSSGWRVAGPAAFSLVHRGDYRYIWRRDVRGARESIDAMWYSRYVPGETLKPECDRERKVLSRVMRGSTFGRQTLSYACDMIRRNEADGLYYAREVYQVVLGADASDGVLTLTYLGPLKTLPRWKEMSDEARDKLLPGREVFRRMQATLSPVESEVPASGPIPLLR